MFHVITGEGVSISKPQSYCLPLRLSLHKIKALELTKIGFTDTLLRVEQASCDRVVGFTRHFAERRSDAAVSTKTSGFND